jgi:hypothetical protein
LYVDDILFMGSLPRLIDKIKKEFMQMWECRDLGLVKEYLGMRIICNHEAKTLATDQVDYALKVVKRFGQYNVKPIKTPLPVGYRPEANLGECTPQQKSYYQSIIGSLLYLALGTRPDIEHAVIIMSQFAANPSEVHIQKSLHIIKYVAVMSGSGLCPQGVLL